MRVGSRIIARRYTYRASPQDLAVLKGALDEAGTKIGRKLFLMNRRALRDRYPSHHHPLPEYNFQDGRSATTPVERLKAIRCLIYQCSEGKVPDSKLYKELEVMSGRLANVIVQNTHEYDGAPWGF